jgi:hypothetical protein
MRAPSVSSIALACVLGFACAPAPPPVPAPPAGAESAYPSNELLAIHEYLESEGKTWRFFHDSVQGKTYQWLITRSVTEADVHYHFKVGREIDASGRVIGGMCMTSDQFFSIRLDRESSEVQEVYGIGG